MKQEIDEFLEKLKKTSGNSVIIGEDTPEDIEKLFKNHFELVCKKCGSKKIYLNFEEGIDYGGYTGYAEGQKVFKCVDCGNAFNFYS